MIQVYFFCTMKMQEDVEQKAILDGFRCEIRGRNVRVDFEDEEEEELERLRSLLERYGCAWQEDED